MNEQIFFLQQQFRDFDLYCENARNWDLDYRQLDKGEFSSELLMFGDANTLFTRATTRRRLLQKGSSPAGLVTFGLLAKADISMNWRNLDIFGNQLFIFPPGGELHGITETDFDVFALSFPEEILDQACHALELPDFRKLVGSNEAFHCHPEQIVQLRTWLQNFELVLTSDGSPLSDSKRLIQLEQELTRVLVSTLAESVGPTDKPVMRKRNQALGFVVNYIEESDIPVSSVQELCSISKVSERTLEYAFRERYGMSPKAYMMSHHLNNVRKTLRLVDPDTARISEIAGHHGFWHMGQFAADYRRLFRELPSETLHKKCYQGSTG